MYTSLHILFRSKKRKYIYTLFVATLWIIWWYFTDISIMLGNYGAFHTTIDILLSMLLILGFPLFLTALMYRGERFGKKEPLSRKNGVWFFSGVLGTIISGASCCGLTLASYFGLIPLMTLLPYDGLEIKILSVVGLTYALWEILKNLDTCKMRK